MNDPASNGSEETKAAQSSAGSSPVVPCRDISVTAAFHWLELGWQDLRKAPRQSLFYGVIMLIISYAIASFTYAMGNLGLYLGLLSGFVFLGPILALALYSISARLERNKPISLALTFRDARRQLSDTIIYTIATGVLFLIWARAASMVYIFFPQQNPDNIFDLLIFLSIGSSVGVIFCTVIFIFSAFSLPLILDRDIDTISAIISSSNAVLRNKPACFVWALCICALTAIGVLTAFLGFVVILPWLGHATWHAYKETIISAGVAEKKLAG